MKNTLNKFIAHRIHFKGDESTQATRPVVRFAIIGIALGLAIMLLAVVIVVGFKKEIRNKIIGFGSHIQITNLDSNTSFETLPITVDASLLAKIEGVEGIQHIEPYATKPGLIKLDSVFQGIVLKGVDEHYDWTFLKKHLISGDLPIVVPDSINNRVLISKDISRMLNLNVGDSFVTFFLGNRVRARKFSVSGIYETGFSDYDRMFLFADIKHIRRLSGWDEKQASGLELTIKDWNKLEETTNEVFKAVRTLPPEVSHSLYIRSVRDLNPLMFNWLDVLDVNVVVILCLMLAVSGFTMISGLLIIILERTKMIGLLKALGQKDKSIRNIFHRVAFYLIVKGMFWGNLIAFFIAVVQKYFKVIKLDVSSYYLDAVPIDLDIWLWLIVNIGTLAISMLMMVAPTYLITKIDPVRTMQFE